MSRLAVANTPDPLAIADDRRLTLKEACAIFYGDNIKPDSLRAEARRGTLQLFRIGRTDFVTAGALRRMEEMKCHVPQSPRASGYTKRSASGSSSTAENSTALAAMKQIGKELKTLSRPTSQASSSRASAKVIPLASPSRKS